MNPDSRKRAKALYSHWLSKHLKSTIIFTTIWSILNPRRWLRTAWTVTWYRLVVMWNSEILEEISIFLECCSVVANVKYRNSFQTKWNRPHSTWADLFKYFVTFTGHFFRMVWSKKSIHYYHVNFRPYDLQKNSCWTFLCWIRHKNGKYEMFNFIMETLKLAQCQTKHPFVNTAFWNYNIMQKL